MPSVWQQVRSLEAMLDADLVHAEGRSLALTDDGQRLLGLVSPLVRGFADLRESFAEHSPLPREDARAAALRARRRRRLRSAAT